MLVGVMRELSSPKLRSGTICPILGVALNRRLQTVVATVAHFAGLVLLYLGKMEDLGGK